MSKDFSAPLKNNGAIYDRLVVYVKDLELFREAKAKLEKVILDVNVTNGDVVKVGCRYIIAKADEIIREELEREKRG